jgi:hypothetical protein
VYGTKYVLDGSVERHKAQLVAKGFSQVDKIGYTKAFAPVAKMNSIHLLLTNVTKIRPKPVKLNSLTNYGAVSV